MHEVTVCDSLLDLAEETARKHNASCIKSIKIRVGEISGVVPELLQHAFDICSKERTMTNRARLIIQRVKPKALCKQCGTEFSPDDFVFICPGCGSPDTKLLQGDELVLDKLELEVEDV